ncbi:MAG: cytochrome P450 [Chloroflexia bacterium]|nr:cytochrome P450 [Chloroflexia bacterium]
MPLPDPIDAVTSGQPACTYAGLASRGAMLWHAERQVWIATREASVRAVLDHPGCRVRPVGQPVPPALAGTAAGDVFGRLVRMNDGVDHRRAKDAIVAALDATDLAEVRHLTRRWTGRLFASGSTRLAFDVPVHVLGALLGVPDDRLPKVMSWTGSFAGAVAPHASAGVIARGIDAAGHLVAECSELLDMAEAGTLPWRLRTAFARAGLDDRDVVIANAIGLLVQTHDATAGLIGNAIVHLAVHPDAIDAGSPLSPQIMKIVRHVSRRDPSIQNTRRFVADDVTIVGTSIPAGASILVLLAGANNESTESWEFGYGRHACPGQAIAMTIAAACVETLVSEGAVPAEAPMSIRHVHSSNARIPRLAGFTGAGQ